MRRGLIHWSLEELPTAALEARVARLQAGMRAEGLRAVLVYASFAQPAPLQWLCNYVPYWSEALLVVWPEGAPTMLVAGTPRTHSWIRSVSHMGELVAAPKPGAQAAEQLGKVLPAGAGRHAAAHGRRLRPGRPLCDRMLCGLQGRVGARGAQRH